MNESLKEAGRLHVTREECLLWKGSKSVKSGSLDGAVAGNKGDGLGGHEGSWLGRTSGGGAKLSWSSSEVWVFEGPRQRSCWILVLFWEDLGGYHFKSSPREGKVGKQVEHFSYDLRGAYWHFGKGSTGKVSGNNRFRIDFGAEVCPFLHSWTKEKVSVRSPFSLEPLWTPHPYPSPDMCRGFP